MKFTGEGGIGIRLGKKENGGRHLVIEVEDTVPGISVEDQNRLFEPFVRPGEAGVQKGTGLGLAISRQFIELARGTIGVVSAPGREPAVPSNADVQRTGFGALAGKSPMSANVYERRSSSEMRCLSRMSAAGPLRQFAAFRWVAR